ncbi:MAG: response regulator transcription factor [Bacteroidales bacterium]|jgi:DNA-binding NarL/FixJ family response regulator|nr:response regulator transcription factor [Bacteroidales bacterium]MBO7380021.1 response regulator transcription factor [Bacteroidales bacterium]MBP5213958.1 response regulator transcription factor [Bacteroidales bacterium]MBP5765147.1 response regulator transcription factor [Bacteroidales bacterium]
MQTSVILADRQDITRIGIQALLVRLGFDSYPLTIAGDESELESALVQAEAPIVIIDTESMEMSLPQKLLTLYEKQPMTRWILFQDEINDQQLSAFSGMPSVSMILKSNSEEEIRIALKCVFHAERFLCHQISNQLLVRHKREEEFSLTQSETDILRLIALGKTVKEIAAIRFSSTHTIVTHKKNIFRKIGVNSVYEATRYALRVGIIGSDYYI